MQANFPEDFADFIDSSYQMSKMNQFSFCESVFAAPGSRWHIRKLSPEGLKLGGGADTETLCGRDLRGGWDIKVQMDSYHLSRCCPKCAEALKEKLRCLT